MKKFVKRKNVPKTIEGYVKKNVSVLDVNCSGRYPNMDQAVQMFLDAAKQDLRIAIYGDYDCDGVTSLSIFTLLARALKLNNLQTIAPGRFTDGYGINQDRVEGLIENNVDLIVTVDNGIAALDPIRRAKEAGVKVLILDHHEAKEELPAADLIVDPHCTGACLDAPFDDLCGAGLSFFFAKKCLDNTLFLRDEFKQELILKMLGIAAIGTIADLVKLQYDNRWIVRHGLEAIHEGHMTVGLRKLIQMAGLDFEKITPMDVGFTIGPTINAAGRMANKGADVMVQILTAETENDTIDKKIARAIQLNQERKDLVAEMTVRATLYMKATDDDNSRFIIYYDETDDRVHKGVAGIVASKLAEKYNAPAIVLSGSGNDVKGSGRTFGDVDILGCLKEVDQSLLVGYGGHPEACGVKVDHDKVDALREALQKVTPEVHVPDYLEYDYDVKDAEHASNFVADMETFGPFGSGNPEPVFHVTGKVVWTKQMGAAKQHIKFTLDNGTDVIWFDGAKKSLRQTKYPKAVEAIGTLSRNVYTYTDRYGHEKAKITYQLIAEDAIVS